MYQTIIAGILGYTLIWGRKDLDRLDGWVARRVDRWQSSHERDPPWQGVQPKPGLPRCGWSPYV